MVKRGDLREVLAVGFISTILGIGVPTLSLFVFGGAENQANMVKFFFYGLMLFSSVFTITLVKLVRSEGFFSRNPDLEPFGRMTVHSPGNTLLYDRLKDIRPVGSFVADHVKDPRKFFLVSWIISLVLGAWIGIRGSFVSGVPDLVEGQVTETAKLSLAVEPAVISETLFFFVFLFYSVVGSVAWFMREKLGLNLFYAVIVGKLVAVILTPLFFLAYHIFRYGTSQAELLGVYLLGFTSALTVALTDSMIFAYMVHAFGNFFHKLAELELFTSEATILLTLGVLVVSTLAYLWVIDPYDVFRDGWVGDLFS